MSLEIIIPLATAVILIILITWLLKTVKSAIKTALIIVSILVALQVAFDIDSGEILQEAQHMLERIPELLLNNFNS